jgi:apolipoprotein N-acyltransferase
MSRLIPIGLGLLSSLLLWLAYFPVNCGPFGWIALVPLLLLGRLVVSRKLRYLSAWLSGLAFFVPAVSWMRVGDPMMYYAWLALALYLSIYFPLAMFLIRRLDRVASLPLCASAPIVWTAMELARAWMLGGLPWYFLGQTQHNVLSMIQIADLGGVYAVSFLVVAVNGLVADALTGQRQSIGRNSVVLLVLLALTFGYGTWRLSQDQFAEGPKVALLQGNIPQEVKDEAVAPDGGNAANRMMREYVALMNEAMPSKPDLAIWPETSFPGGHVFPAAGVAAIDLQLWSKRIDDSKSSLAAAGTAWQTPVLLGVITADVGPGEQYRQFNSAVLVAPDGVVRERYNKVHRVPFGEYVPLVETFPWLKNFTPYDGLDYTVAAGTHMARFELPIPARTYRFGVLICYEDSEAGLACSYVVADPVDFLVNISNDGWFKGTQEHEQHLAVSRFRAVECRRSLVRAVNMGVSAVIDPNGRVTHTPGPTWAASKAIAAVVIANVPIDNRWSFYAWAGDWLPLGCWFIIIGVCMKGCRFWNRSRQ